MTPKPVPTNGIGKRATAHLNLTVTLADVDRRPKPGLPLVRMTMRGLPVQRPPYAGYDRTERAL